MLGLGSSYHRFLWAACQLDQLSRVRPAISKELVCGLPNGLEQTFEAGLLKLGDADRVFAVEILRWLMYSRRPLSIEELVEAIAVKPVMESLKQLTTQYATLYVRCF